MAHKVPTLFDKPAPTRDTDVSADTSYRGSAPTRDTDVSADTSYRGSDTNSVVVF